MQARHEYKHSLNYMDYILLRDRLKAAMHRDPHAGPAGEYRVRSIYFDTPSDKALREKVDGMDNREKFRLRRYPGSGDGIFLEKKSKTSGLSYKQSQPITRAECEELLAGPAPWMRDTSRPLAYELYAKMASEGLRPKTIVDYTREPFATSAGNVRVTFDRDIHTGLYSTDFLSDSVPTIAAGDELVILEVKYDEFLPEYIARLLAIDARRATSCSKYQLSRIYG